MPQLRALSTFWWGQRVINQGDIIASTDPVAKAAPLLFEVVAPALVEQATAAPGERRTLTRPKKGAPRRG